MALESTSTIDGLVATNPITGDRRSEGDDHLRLVKAVLKATFPGFAGRFGRVQTKNSSYSAAVNDNWTVIRATTNLTLSLLAAATLGNGWTQIIYTDGGIVTIDPNGAEEVNGEATVDIPDGSFAFLVCTGTDFYAAILPIAKLALIGLILDAGFTMNSGKLLGRQSSGVGPIEEIDIPGAVDITGKMDKAQNLNDVADKATARTNLDVPTRAGSGASGTWGINISGNAATATTATNATNAVSKDNGALAVGSYLFAFTGGSGVNSGDTIAGTSLYGGSGQSFGINAPGTWRNVNGFQIDGNLPGLWQRIS